MGIALSLLGAGCLILGSAKQTDRHISLQLPAAPVPKIVEQLSKAAGIPMAATAVLAKDVVTIDVHDRPLSEVMDRLAAVLNSSWKNDKGVFRLNRSDKQSRDQETKENAYRLHQIEEEIATSKAIRQAAFTLDDAKKLRVQLEKLRDKDPRYSFGLSSDLSNPIGMAPARRALLRAIATMDMTDVATMVPGDRIAWSNKPTHTERQLSFSADDLLAQYATDQNTWAEAASGVTPTETGGMAGDPLNATDAIAQTPDRLLLVASRGNSTALVNFRLYILAGDSTLAYADAPLTTNAMRTLSKTMFGGAETAGLKITLSPSSLAMLDATKGFGRPSQGKNATLTPAAIEMISHPDNVDPLALVPTDGLISVAEARHENLIASLPDDLVGLSFMPNAAGQTVDSFLQTATILGDLDVTEKDGWLSAKPNRPYSAQFLRIDRSALGKYLRSIVNLGRATLDNQAEFALASPPTDYDTFGTPMGMLLDLNSTQNVDKDWTTLKLWGSLTRDQRTVLLGGQKIPFKDLSAEQFELASREAYHRAFKNLSNVPSDPNHPFKPGDMMRYTEPTECLPDGLPREGTLSIAGLSSSAILASSTTQNIRMSYARVFDESSLGSSLAYYSDQPPSQNPMFDRFQMIKSVKYTFQFKYNPYVSDRSELHDLIVPDDSTPVPFQSLPKDVQDKVTQAEAQAKSAPQAQPVRRAPPPR